METETWCSVLISDQIDFNTEIVGKTKKGIT